MRRWMIALTLAAGLCMSASAAHAGPGCCKSKTEKDAALKAKMVAGLPKCATKSTCASKATCSMDKAAFPSIERKFVVAGEIFDTEEQAWAGLAAAAEQYVKQYTSIACVIDGKVVYCGDKDATCQSGDATPVALVADRTGTCDKGAAKLTATCDKTKATCDKGAKVALASAEDDKDEPACCKAKLACCEAAKKAGKKGNCCKGEAKVAAAESQCIKSKTTALVSAEGEKATCNRSKLAQCDKSKATAVAATEKSGCCKSNEAKLASAEGKSGCCKSNEAKLASAEDKSGCCKSNEAKLASAEGKSGCCKSKTAALASAGEKSDCCKSKGATYRVAGRDYATWEQAVEARDAAVAAAEKVHMAYLVDGKKVDCATKVCPKAKAAGQVKFVVGDVTTGCELHARVELAKAQIEAIRGVAATEKVATR